jgi:hypothetical protein
MKSLAAYRENVSGTPRLACCSLTFLADVAPVLVVKVESTSCGLPNELFWIVGSEGSVAAQQDVGDDSVKK